jgi:prepilin-type N-terminal cleavage/methylation domain-containing protein
MKASKKTLQRGDTIVEVMIAMAVLGLVLASAFAISNRSYATGINAQERNEALKVAESQVELLRIASTLTDESIIDADPSSLFCIEPSSAKLERIEFASSAVVEDQGELDKSQYPQIDPLNGDCNFGTSDRYYVSIQQSADIDDETNQPTGGQIFSVRVYWESISGGASNVVNHEYRTYNFEGTFSLMLAPARPTVTTNAVTALSVTTATVEGEVVNSIGSAVTDRGFVASLSQEPTIADNDGIVSSGSGLGLFEATFTELSPSKNYFVRAYATNTTGTNYGLAIPLVTVDVDPLIMIYAGSSPTGSSEYYISNGAETCTVARQITAASGGHLVDIESEAENTQVSRFATGFGRIWIGANDVGTESRWAWSDNLHFWQGLANGNSVSGRYSNWASGEPNDYKAGGATPQGEDCAVMNWNGSGGQWNDWYANGERSSTARFVIEFDVLTPAASCQDSSAANFGEESECLYCPATHSTYVPGSGQCTRNGYSYPASFASYRYYGAWSAWSWNSTSYGTSYSWIEPDNYWYQFGHYQIPGRTSYARRSRSINYYYYYYCLSGGSRSGATCYVAPSIIPASNTAP